MPKRSNPKQPVNQSKKTSGKRSKKEYTLAQDEEISSSDDDNYFPDDKDNGDDEEDDNIEDELSPEETRKKLAKEYLSSFMDNDESDAESNDSEDISNVLREKRLRSQGKYYRNIAANLENIGDDDVVRRSLNYHNDVVTCIALSSDEKNIYSCSKDNSLIKWDTESGQKFELEAKWNGESGSQRRNGELLTVAVTTDNRYVASGGRDNKIRIYDSRASAGLVKTFDGHRDAITSLAFQKDTYALFSGSLDRCIKHWDVNEMGYVETLFGHQDAVTDIDCYGKLKPLSASLDRSVRYWKVAEESHLVYRGHKSSVDCAKILTEDCFVSAGQDGSLNLWRDSQKNPIVSLHNIHGHENISARWVTSLATVKMTNLAATGSYDGFLRLWDVNTDSRSIKKAAEFSLEGVINSLAITPNIIVAGTGREHKFGRWWKVAGNRNKVTILRYNNSLENSN